MQRERPLLARHVSHRPPTYLASTSSALLTPSKQLMGDHVPLQFLLGTRASRYLDHRPRASATAASDIGSSVAQPLFRPAAHPRSREREARALLERVLREPLANDWTQGDNLVEDASRSQSTTPPLLPRERALAQLVESEIVSQRQLLAEEELSRSHNPRRRSGARHDQADANNRREQVLEFHGYRVANPRFLGVEGLARTPFVATPQQSEDRRSRKIQRMKQEKRRRKEMQELLREQQEETRAAERRLRERSSETAALVLTKHDLASACDLPELTASAPALTALSTAAYAEQQLIGRDSTHARSWPALQQLQYTSNQYEKGCQGDTAHLEKAAVSRKEKLELARQQKRLLARAAAPRPSFLATLRLEIQCDESEDESSQHIDSESNSLSRQIAELGLTATNSERARARADGPDRDGGDDPTPEMRDDLEAIRNAKLQRELFAKSEFGGKCLGGGFAVKRNAHSGGSVDAGSGLEAVLGAQAIRSKSMTRRAAAARRK